MGVQVRIKRSYDKAEASDGYRVLVDRLWPRGLSKSSFHYDEWCKDLAPSTDLRKWFGHKPENWPKFKADYLQELRTGSQQALIKALLARVKQPTITLLYSAKDTEHNQAIVLAAEIQRLAKGS